VHGFLVGIGCVFGILLGRVCLDYVEGLESVEWDSSGGLGWFLTQGWEVWFS